MFEGMSQEGWDIYFYRIARDVQEKSKDIPQVGAVIVRVDKEDEDQIIISTGFNGAARKVQDLPDRLDDYEANRCEACGRADIKEKLRWMCRARGSSWALPLGGRLKTGHMWTSQKRP